MISWFYPFVSVFIVSLLSFSGVLFLVLSQKLLGGLLLFLVSFSAGALLGDSFIHLLPEAVAEQGFNLNVSLMILAGLLTFFVLEKFICWRHCHIPTSKSHLHKLGIMNLFGDGIHNFIDGMVIAGSFLAGQTLGISTTLAVIFHEVPQEIGDFGVLVYGGYSKTKALVFNFVSALMAVLGAILVLIIGPQLVGFSQIILPFTAGGFIYIAGSDLIPELHKETSLKKSFFQFLGLVLGIGAMLVLKKFSY